MTQTSRKSIKLLVVSQYYYPEQFRINDMCAEWVKRGYDVTVVTGIPNYPQGRFYSGYGWINNRKETHDGVKIIRLPIISRGTSKIRLGLNYLSFVVSGYFWKVFTRQKADIVFSFEVSPMTQVLPAVWFANRRKISCIVYVQDLWPDNFQETTGIKDGLLVRLITRITNYIYHQCKLILVTSNSFKKAVENRGVPGEKVVFWPQYAEDFNKPSATVSPLVPLDNRFTIAYTGNIGTAQWLEILPKVALLLRGKGAQVRFLLVGDGRGMPALKDAIMQLDVEDYFHFISQQPPQTIPSILAGADAAFISFVNKPLFQMTIPAKLQSYMACGMPIIAAAGGETRQVIEEAKCGWCCNSGDTEGLANIIVDFMEHPKNEKEEMKANAIDYSEVHYNRKSLMDRMDAYLLEAVADAAMKGKNESSFH